MPKFSKPDYALKFPHVMKYFVVSRYIICTCGSSRLTNWNKNLACDQSWRCRISGWTSHSKWSFFWPTPHQVEHWCGGRRCKYWNTFKFLTSVLTIKQDLKADIKQALQAVVSVSFLLILQFLDEWTDNYDVEDEGKTMSVENVPRVQSRI